MSTNTSTKNQINTWGRQSATDSGTVDEPQRSDLFFVRLEAAAKEIRKMLNPAAGNLLAHCKPQLARSVDLPATIMKAEPYRRNSITYNMPAWDEPLEAIKIVFLYDTHEGTDQSTVCDLLDAWQTLVRIGRGARTGGYATLGHQGYLLLDSTYTFNFKFNIPIMLLRGMTLAGAKKAAAAQDNETVNFVNEGLIASYRTNGAPVPKLLPSSNILPRSMNAHTTLVLRGAWCAGYKLGNLAHDTTGLVTVEATFYADSLERNAPALPAAISAY